MKNKIKFLLTIIGILFCHSQVFSQTSNFSGTWVLNFEKSNLEFRPQGLTNFIFIIQQEGNKFKLIRYQIFGEKKNKISFKMVADGRTRRVKMLFKGKLEQKENSLQATMEEKFLKYR
jgi:hypothetical protein